jgi:hypothetical protein
MFVINIRVKSLVVLPAKTEIAIEWNGYTTDYFILCYKGHSENKKMLLNTSKKEYLIV